MDTAPQTLLPSASHLQALDGVRGAAAFYVLVHHAWLQAGLGFYLFGHFAVGLFITLSGFCLMLPVVQSGGELRGGAKGFFARRARRILPPYYAAVLLSLGIGYLITQFPGGHPAEILPSPQSVLAHLLLLQDALPGWLFSVNGALWTISVEWRIYFLFPLIVRGWGYIGAWSTTLVTVFASVALFLLLRETELNVAMHGISPQFLGLFVMGTLAAGIAFSSDPKLQKTRESPWVLPLFLVLTLALLVLAKTRPWTVHYTDYIVGIWASCLLILVTTRPAGTLARLFSWKPLVFVGTFAYSLYLTHVPLLRVFWLRGVVPLTDSNLKAFLLLLIFAVPLTLLAAYGFFCLCERPLLRRKSPANHPFVPIR